MGDCVSTLELGLQEFTKVSPLTFESACVLLNYGEISFWIHTDDDKRSDVKILKRACDAQVFERGLDRRL